MEMVEGLKKLADKIKASIVQNMQYIEPRFFMLSTVAVVGFPLYYFIWHDIFPQPYENLTLRLIGVSLFVPFMFAKYWPESLRRYQPVYWYAVTLYSLPFFFTFMLLMNGVSTVWLMSTLVSVFIMVLLLNVFHLIFQFIFGSALGWFGYYLITGETHIQLEYWKYLPIYIFAIVAGGLLNFSSKMLQQERLRAMLSATSNIAHELRTPLLGIRSGAAGVRHYLPALLECYQTAKAQGLPVTPIRNAHLQAMQGVLDRIEEEADHSNTIIDMLLMNTRTDVFVAENNTQCSMKKCVALALQRYSFASEKEKQALVWNHENEQDFHFRGVELLMVHVLFNLLKNAFFHIAKANKGGITIQLSQTPQANMLVFRDTASGIPADVLPHIFRRFYSWSPDNEKGFGAGIGLSFCRNVIESFGGTITCHSTLGEYTEFILTFPPQPMQEKNL